MDQENVVFQQRTNSKGDIQYRAKFGRQKAFVFVKQRDFFYIDLYDNRPGKTDKIGLGLDELDALIKLRPNLESLKHCFQEQPAIPRVRGASNHTQPPPTPSDNGQYQFLRPVTPPKSYTIERIPLQSIQSPQQSKRPASRDENHDQPKKPKIVYEDVHSVTQTGMTDDENVIPQEVLSEFLYTPLFDQDI